MFTSSQAEIRRLIKRAKEEKRDTSRLDALLTKLTSSLAHGIGLSIGFYVRDNKNGVVEVSDAPFLDHDSELSESDIDEVFPPHLKK